MSHRRHRTLASIGTMLWSIATTLWSFAMTLAGIIAAFLKYLFRWSWHMPFAVVLACTVAVLVIPQEIVAGAEIWALDTLLGHTGSTESQDIYIVSITDEDYRSALFNSRSPLSAESVKLLLAKVVDLSRPKVIGVDLDTKDDEWAKAVDNSICEILDGTPHFLQPESGICKPRNDNSELPADVKCAQGVSCLMPKGARVSVVWARIPVERKTGSSIQVYQLLGGRPGPDDAKEFSGIPRFSLDFDGLVRRYQDDFKLDDGTADGPPVQSFAKAIAEKYHRGPVHTGERIFNFTGAKKFPTISSLLNNLVFEALLVSSFEFWLSCEGVVWVVLSTEPAHPRHVSCSGHQVSQSAQIVGGPGEGEQPPDLVDPSQLHFL